MIEVLSAKPKQPQRSTGHCQLHASVFEARVDPSLHSCMILGSYMQHDIIQALIAVLERSALLKRKAYTASAQICNAGTTRICSCFTCALSWEFLNVTNKSQAGLNELCGCRYDSPFRTSNFLTSSLMGASTIPNKMYSLQPNERRSHHGLNVTFS